MWHGGDDHGGTTLGSGDFIPPVAAHPTHTAIQPLPPPPTIDWSTVDSTSTVLIPAGVTVTISGNIECDEIRVEGTLQLLPGWSTALKATTILVSPTGKLVSRPAPGATHTFIFRDAPLEDSDFEQIKHGLIVLGEIDIEGEAKTSYADTAKPVAAKSSTVELTTVPADWKTGDVTLLPDTSRNAQENNWSQRERRTISSIGGSTITVDVPFTFAHDGVKDYLGKIVAFAPIANLTRSVVFRSENPAGVRGHCLFGDNAKVSLKFAAFKDMGRTRAVDWINSTVRNGETIIWKGTNQNGRYPLHLHHSKTPAVIEGCVIDGSPKWGIAIHNSHGNSIKNNVVVDAVGAGIVTEQGNETGNQITGNYVIGCNGSGSTTLGRGDAQTSVMRKQPDGSYKAAGDIGHEGAAFWFHGTRNWIVGNFCANTETGFVVWVRANGEARDYGFEAFDGNTVYFAGTGLLCDGTSPPEPVLVTNFSALGVASGVKGSYSNKFVFESPTVIGFGHNFSHAIDFNFLSKLTVRNGNIQLTDYGIMPRTNFEITDTFFAKNRTADISIVNSNWTDTPGTTGILRNNRHATSSVWISDTWNPIELHVPHVGFPRHVYVYDHNGVKGGDFELFMREQAAGTLVKAAGAAGRKTPAEITNGELWAGYGVALGGQVATDATTRTNIIGLVRALPADQTPPEISSVTTEILSPTSVRIRWTTDEPATTALEYAPVLSDDYFGKFATPDNSLKTEHEVVLTGLVAGSYAFRPYGTDASGNTRYIVGGGSYLSRKVYGFNTK